MTDSTSTALIKSPTVSPALARVVETSRRALQELRESETHWNLHKITTYKYPFINQKAPMNEFIGAFYSCTRGLQIHDTILVTI